ncbi:MAG TPA: hypothetical protein VIC28_12700 [Thermoanaerobaculia bacterium]|jgi:hypothetical protein
MSFGRRLRSAAMVVPALWLLACGEALPPLQTTPLAGAAVDLQKFEGGWFDPDGNLIAVVTSGTDSRFLLRVALPTGYMHLTGARLQDDAIDFTVRGGGTYGCSLQLADTNAAEVACGCTGTLLVRDPSPLWFVKPATHKAARFAREAYEGAFDWLSRIL